MNVKLFKQVLIASLLSTGLSSIAMAHSITNGQLAANPNSIDVFRTTCVSLSTASISAQGLTGQIQPGPANEFIFAVSLTKGKEVDVTVGTSSVGNIEGVAGGTFEGVNLTNGSGANNVLPATSINGTTTIETAFTKDTTIGNPWLDINQTSEPTFTGVHANAPFGTTGILAGADNNVNNDTAYTSANGEYVIVISHPGNVATNYDFIGHCVNTTLNTASGFTIDSIHTGQGTWFTQSDTVTLVPVDVTSSGQDLWSQGDYDQVISGAP